MCEQAATDLGARERGRCIQWALYGVHRAGGQGVVLTHPLREGPMGVSTLQRTTYSDVTSFELRVSQSLT